MRSQKNGVNDPNQRNTGVAGAMRGIPEPSYEPRNDEWLTLEDAVCLPEFGGRLLKGQASQRGVLTVNTLRAAIERGELSAIKLGRNKIFVTRDILKQWSELCRVCARNHTSTSELPAATMMESRPTKQPSLSETASKKFPQDAVSLMLDALSKS
ncbi:hypothetical protein ASG50_17895 [Rhizobium sp. Leaf386]|nr:hypothetical protein ASG50_17895 [Rhizobium sp. Leaf386]